MTAVRVSHLLRRPSALLPIVLSLAIVVVAVQVIAAAIPFVTVVMLEM